MAKVTVYGLGGYDPSKPNNNILEEYDDGQPELSAMDTQALAESLATLPEETLNALKQALGLNQTAVEE
jgi:hypothetical protein